MRRIKVYCYNIQEKSVTEKVFKKAAQLKLYYGDQKNFPDELTAFYDFLSDKEIQRSKRFIKKADERTYVITHALVNRKIAGLLGKDFNKLKINYFDNKKPFVEGSTIDFNLSHSSDYFAFAISIYENVCIGVDIEVVRENFDISPIVKNYFHKNEISYILNSGSNNLTPQRRFYEVWTRKEAFLKMLGIGLSEKLSEIDMSPGAREINIQDNNSFDNHYFFFNTYIYTLNLPGNLVLSISTNLPASIIPEHSERF